MSPVFLLTWSRSFLLGSLGILIICPGRHFQILGRSFSHGQGDLDKTMLITRWISMWFLGQIHPNGPNRPSIRHQFSCSLWFSSCWKCMKIWHLPRWCLLALHFHVGLWKIIVLLQWQFENACWTPSNNVTFFGWFFVSPKRHRFFYIVSTCITWSVFTECTTQPEVCSPH